MQHHEILASHSGVVEGPIVLQLPSSGWGNSGPLIDCLTLKLEELLSSESSGIIYQSSQCNIPESLDLQVQYHRVYMWTNRVVRLCNCLLLLRISASRMLGKWVGIQIQGYEIGYMVRQM